MPSYIPYGAYWSTPFVRWQGELAHLHSMRFAAEVTKQALAERGLQADQFDFCAYGMTVIQHQSFFGTPWFTALIGAEALAGPTISQACATGARLVATAMGEIALGQSDCALIVSGDRTSNGAHVFYPAPSAPGGTGQGENFVMDNFNNDPWAKGAMIDTAENVAARAQISTQEQHDLVACRYDQYQAALADDRAFQRRYMPAEIPIPDAGFRKQVGVLTADQGVQAVETAKMAGLRPVRPGGTVTFAGQTHPADGSAGMVVVSSAERAAEMAPANAPKVEILATAQAREQAGYMPAAPILATQRLLDQTGLTISDFAAIKSHNPFAVNDIAFARAFDVDWRGFNNYGSSLIWGHPQGPTGLRAMIELIEELALRGGGLGLFQGCAAGDSAMAVAIKVS